MKRDGIIALPLLLASTLLATSITLFAPIQVPGSSETAAKQLTSQSEGVSLEEINEGTVDDVLAIAQYISVARVTLPTGGTAQWVRTERPSVILIEDGHPSVLLTETFPAPAMLVRSNQGESANSSASQPLIVIPGTAVEMDQSDLLSAPGRPSGDGPANQEVVVRGPYPSDETVTFVAVNAFLNSDSRLLASSAGEPISQMLDISLGLSTAQPSAPPSIVAYRLVVQPDSTMSLTDLSPAMLILQEGQATVSVRDGEVDIQKSGEDYVESPVWITANESASLSAGDAAFWLPGTVGDLVSTGEEKPIVAILLAFGD